MTDLWLAIAHHIAIFALFGMFIAEFVSIKPGLDRAGVRRVAAMDALYGGLAALVIIVGVLRLFYGAKGWAFYETNPWFWAKMAAFALMGIASIPPTLTILRWKREAADDPAKLPGEGEIKRVRRLLHIEALLLGAIPLLAAAMARYGSF